MNIQVETGCKTTLIGDEYLPDGKPEKIILLIHGLGEHFGRYKGWCTRFTEKGFAVLGVDLPGHGRSPGRRGHVKSYQVYNDVIDSLALFTRKRFGDIPIGIYGHSLGGSIVLNYLLTNTMGMDFGIVTSPWIRLSSPPSKGMLSVARILNFLIPGLIQPNGLNREDLTHDAEVNEVYNDDQLVHSRISVRLANEAIDAGKRILETNSNIDVPVLILHGEQDNITSPDGSKDLDKLSSRVELKIWAKGFHELHNEPFKEEVFNYILSWVKK